jgi:hypothetical protein
MTRWPTWFEISVWTTPSAPVTTAIAIIPPTSAVRRPVRCFGIASSKTSRRRNGEAAPRLAETTISAETTPSLSL